MAYTYRLHPEADKDYAAAYAWYENQLDGLGEKFIGAIKKKIAAIAEHPELYGSKSKGFRETIVNKNFPFVIVYKIYHTQKEIYISAIYHQKRNPRKKYRK